MEDFAGVGPGGQQRVIAEHLRVAEAVALLYAHPVTATVQLTINDVRVNSAPALRLGDGFQPLLDPLSELIASQIGVAARPRGRGRPTSQWLFPGGRPGHHLGAGHLHTRLHAAGIDIKASKNTAIAAMITELPGPVVANALNLHPSTTTAGPEASPHLADLRLPPNTMTM